MRIDGVSPGVIETWVRRDFGLTSAQLLVAIELRDGKCPVFLPGVRGITPRDLYLAHVIRLLPDMAKKRCAVRVQQLAGIYTQYLFPKPKQPEYR